MPSRTKKLDRAVTRLHSIPKELVVQFLTGPMTGEAINAAGIAFKQSLIEASLKRVDAPPGLRAGRGPAGVDGQPAQRRHRQDGADRRRQAAHRVAARPGRQFRAFAAAQARAPFHGFDDSIVALYARGLRCTRSKAIWPKPTAPR